VSARHRKQKHEEHESHERWLVSYADFITLLFAFFTVLYATSQQDTVKEKEFEKSIRQSFAALGLGGGFGAGAGASASPGLGAGDADSGGLPRANLSRDAAIEAPEAFPGRRASPAEVQDYVERRAHQDLSDEEYKKAIGEIRHDALGVRIQLASSALFPAGSADLRPEALGALEKIGALLKASNRRLIVEGHTDDEPIHTARFPTNWELSAGRATKIVRYLSQRHGVDERRLAAVAYADKKPVGPNDSEANRARNRRIEILIVTGDAPTE
jgi:chemotaxis protein MotB